MAETATTTAPTGTPGTAAATAETSSTSVAATTAATSETTTQASKQASTTQGATAATTQTTTEAAKPLFTISPDVKFAPEAVSAFEAAMKGKLVGDKVNATPQEIADMFVAQATDANTRWQKQLTDLNASNETACKTRFTPAQLAASEKAIGFLSSFDESFREVAKRQLNDPSFVNAMRIVGERLSEDRFEIAGNPSPAAPKTRAEKAQLFYGKKTA